ncbi:endonuclease/exonuclease/phosphatase family protein [Nocardioides guangzhouensis]|nr:endonuclease/exonuclease/phosphatase family protein [Nocardioides guangzhouensis]
MTRSRWTLPAALVVALGLAAPLATVPASQGAVAAQTVTTRMGTYNIRAGVSTATFERAVRDLATRVDVAGLQEVNHRDKEAVLANLPGFGYFRPARGYGEQNPVIWDSSRFTKLSATHRRLSARTYIGNELGRPGQYVAPIFSAVVRLRDDTTRQRLTVVNVHLTPGAVYGGNPVPGRPRVWRLFTRQIANLMDVVAAEKRSAKVFVTGDFNVGWVADERTRRTKLPFMSFRRQSFASNWATRHDWNRGTHSKSLIDQVWTNQRAATASVIFSMGYSDHYPGIGTYQLPVATTTAG